MIITKIRIVVISGRERQVEEIGEEQWVDILLLMLSWTVNSQVFTMSSSFITGYIDFEEINVT